MNVLIVDDSKIVRRVLSNTIQRYFKAPKWPVLNLYEAEDGNYAMDFMKQDKVDIVLLDWNMPNMNGEEVVDAIRANKEWNKTRIVMATTEGSKDSVLKMIKKGANGYMVKPFNEAAVFKTLDTITARMAKV
ncbi:MAG: two-component system chemotaxis response regulator CheY [Sulfurimonas sp.]|jgi:two-component system chemotaxis response regulator CheY|uniref:response regulator n=1 Tax=Sulfurimonas sp. TaxID=2022749 RepID=UPI0039E3EE78